MEAKIKELIEIISAKTEKKEAKWEKVPLTDQFSLLLGTGKITINKYANKTGYRTFQAVIYNGNGDIILSVLENSQVPVSPDYAILKDFYEKVRRNYFKVDETIDGLINESKKEGEIGKEDSHLDDLPF